MDPLQQAIDAARARAVRKPRTARLDSLLKDTMDRRISPTSNRYSALLDAWTQLLPEELAEHCEIVDFQNGSLKVKVSSPSYRYELQLCLGELLQQLQRQCPRARVRKIQLTPASAR